MREQPASKISESLVIGYCYCGQWEPTPAAQTSLGAKNNGKTSPGKGDQPISKCRATPTTCTTLLSRCGLWLFFCGSGSNNKLAPGSRSSVPYRAASWRTTACEVTAWRMRELASQGAPAVRWGVRGNVYGLRAVCVCVGGALQRCWKPVIEYSYASWTHVSLFFCCSLLLKTTRKCPHFKWIAP